MATVGDLIVKLGADVRGFNRGMDSAQQRLDRMGRNIEGLGKRLSLAFTLPTVAAGGFALKIGGEMEQAEIAFKTLLGSAKEARAFLEELYDFAARTPFEIRGLQSNARLLLAYGFQAKELLPTLKLIGDATSALGGSPEMLERIIRAMGQIRAKGSVKAEELRQLAETGLPVFEILQEELGLTAEQVANIGNEGVSAARGLEALQRGIEKRFGGAMADQMASLNGKLSNLKDAIVRTADAWAQDWLPTAKRVVDVVTNFVKRLQALDKEQRALITRIGLIAAAIPPVIIGVGLLIQAFGLLASVAGLIGGALALVFSPITLGILAAIAAVGLFKMAWDKNWGGIQDKAEAFKEWFNNDFMPELRRFLDAPLQTTWDWIVTGAGNAWDWLQKTSVWEWLTGAWDKITGGISTAWDWTLTAGGNAWDWIKSHAVWLLEKIGAAGSIATSWVWQFLQNVGTELWHWLINNPVSQWIGEKVTTAWQWTIRALGDIWKWLRDTAAPWIGGAFETTWTWTIEGLDELRELVNRLGELSGFKGLLRQLGLLNEDDTLNPLFGGTGSAAAVPATLPTGGEAFTRAIAAMIAQTARDMGLTLSDEVIQAMAKQLTLESNFGQSGLSQQANNFGGFKGQGPAGSVTMATSEFENGEWVRRNAEFQAFASPQQFIEAYLGLLERRWPDALAESTAEGFLRGLQTGDYKYATDPNYAAKVLAIPGFHEGGLLPGHSGPDQFPAILAPGEAVVPSRAVRGGWPAVLKWFQDQGVPGFAGGMAPRVPNVKLGGFDAGSLQGLLDGISKAVQGVGKILLQGFMAIMDFLMVVIEALGRAILGDEGWEKLADTVKNARDELKKLIDFLTGDGPTGKGDNKPGTRSGRDALRGGKADAAMSFWERVLKEAKSFGEKLVATIRDANAIISDALAPFYDDEGQFQFSLSGLIDSFLSLITHSETFERLMEAIEPIAQAVADALGKLLEPLLPLVNLFGAVLGPVLEVFGTIIKSLLLPIMPILFNALKFLGLAVLALAIGIGAVWNAIATVINALLGWLGVHLGMIDLPGLGKSFNELMNMTYEDAAALSEHKKAVDEVTASLKNVPDGFKTALRTFQSASGVRVPALAAGGIVSRPTLALIGERGPEAVVPLGRDMGTGGDVNVTIVSNDPDVIWRKLQPLIERGNNRRSGTPIDVAPQFAG